MSVCISSVCKYLTVFELCLVAFPFSELCLLFQIHVSSYKQSFIDVDVQGTDRHIKFQMVN